jgi:hypothetical protein
MTGWFRLRRAPHPLISVPIPISPL